MKKVMITLLILILAALSLFASYNDTIKFQIDLTITNAVHSVLQIQQYDDDDLITSLGSGTFRRSLNVENDSTEHPICKIYYETNVIGNNRILVSAEPLYPAEYNSENDTFTRITNEPGVGYELVFYTVQLNNSGEESESGDPESGDPESGDPESGNSELNLETTYWEGSLDVSNRGSSTFYLLCKVPSESKNIEQFVFNVAAVFTDYDEMGQYSIATVTIGKEGL